ncbi:acyclic terpene utilization AtuA family protein [Sphingomonas sp. CLY1604]|uniref:acyclic terpene utilization AtuA family protein n=1 Tax=Sphingomonas sp. CLY1604 TaxID=3457786 RepID=UPI003FD7D54B
MIKIGSGAGFAGDRIPPARDLAERGDIHYLVFECLAERTIALSQDRKRQDPELGYNEWLEERFEACLPACHRRGIRIVTNMGAANPIAAGHKVAEIARRLNITGLTIGVVTGDDVLDLILTHDYPLMEKDAPVRSVTSAPISANAYLGSEAVVEALGAGAHIVITGRIADPSLYLAPLIHEFGWSPADWSTIAKGAHVGHLLECGAHATGGYFVDPGFKDVPDPARIGFPIAEVEEDGAFVVTKIPGTGGAVRIEMLKEQTLYEVHDPSNYPTADCVVDFSAVEFEEVGPDRVRVTGAAGRPRPASVKVSVGYVDGFIGEGQMSYCGPNAVARGRCALEMVRQRLTDMQVPVEEGRFELIGVDAVARGGAIKPTAVPNEVRIRVACRTPDRKSARKIGHEVEALWLNGPAGGGGATTAAHEVVAIASTLVPRDAIATSVTYLRV